MCSCLVMGAVCNNIFHASFSDAVGISDYRPVAPDYGMIYQWLNGKNSEGSSGDLEKVTLPLAEVLRFGKNPSPWWKISWKIRTYFWRTVLKPIHRKYSCEIIEWAWVIKDRVRLWALVSTLTKCPVP